MKKIIFLTLALISLNVLSHAQNAKSFYRSSYESRNSGSFNQAFSLVTLGYGFPNLALPGDVFLNNGYSHIGIGPMYVKYEHGFLRDEIGLGGHIAFSNALVRYTNFNGTKSTNTVTAFSAAFKGFYHFNKLIPVKDLDVYASAGLSIWSRTYHYDSNWPAGARTDYSGTQVYPVFQIGARFYVKPKLGLYAEGGYDQMSQVNMGVTFKL